MENFNTIKAFHFKINNGVLVLGKKAYFWHIPKNLRSENIKKGDMVLVNAKHKKVKAIVADVFREELEDTRKRYNRVVKKYIH